MIPLISREGGAGLRPDQAVDRAAIISLVAQRQLHVLEHLTGSEIVVAVDRLAVGVVVVERAVAVGRIPVAAVPIIIAAAEEDEGGVVTAPPPIAIVPRADDATLRDGEAVAIEVAVAAIALHRDLRIRLAAIDLLIPIIRLGRRLRALAIPAVEIGLAFHGLALHRRPNGARCWLGAMDRALGRCDFALRLLDRLPNRPADPLGRCSRCLLGALIRGGFGLAFVLLLLVVVVIGPHHLRQRQGESER